MKTSVKASFLKHAPHPCRFHQAGANNENGRETDQTGAKESRTKFRITEAEEQTISLTFSMRKRRKNECSETPYPRITGLHPLGRWPRSTLEHAKIRYRSIARRADIRRSGRPKMTFPRNFTHYTLRRAKCQDRQTILLKIFTYFLKSLFYGVFNWAPTAAQEFSSEHFSPVLPEHCTIR